MNSNKIKSKEVLVKSINAEQIEIRETNLDALEENQSIVNVKYVPFTHWDIIKVSGKAEVDFPFIPCIQLSGVVEDSMDKSLIGKRVSYLSLEKGCCRNRIVVNNNQLFLLNDDIDLQKACLINSNPHTAYGVVDMAVSLNAKAFAVTAGNSTVGRMIYKIAQDFGIKCIPIVRSPNRKNELENEGFTDVIDSSVEDFTGELSRAMERHSATVIMDNLSGAISGKLMKALPEKGTLVNFGTQTREPMSGIDATDMRWKDKQIKSFLVGRFLTSRIQKGDLKQVHEYILKNHSGIFNVEIEKVFSVNKFKEAYDYMKDINPKSKVVLEFD